MGTLTAHAAQMHHLGRTCKLRIWQRRARKAWPVATFAGSGAAASSTAQQQSQRQPAWPLQTTLSRGLFYDGIVFDMVGFDGMCSLARSDGTLTETHIDFDDMRRRTGIPQGDLFTVMEAWQDCSKVKAAMDIILDIERNASSAVCMKEGLLELLQMISQRQVKVALVTRNTKESVDAFFSLIGEHRRQLFDIVLTREFVYVKPDRRLLQHVAEAWGVEPSRLLMVGDSVEDIEVGNTTGTASCLVAGGGNERPGAVAIPSPGSIPTFTVHSLLELKQLLEAAADALPGPSSVVKLGWPARLAAREMLTLAGAPPPGLDFIDWLAVHGDLTPAECSFPRMGAAAGGLATCEAPGSSVLHIGCGSGALTKVLASQGMRTVAMELDVGAARRRGLTSFEYQGRPLSRGSLSAAKAIGPYSTVVVSAFQRSHNFPVLPAWDTYEALGEIKSVLAVGGQLAVDSPLPAGSNAAMLVADLQRHGFDLLAWQSVRDETEVVGCLRLRVVTRLKEGSLPLYH